MRKWLVVFIAIGLLASLVQASYRFGSEAENKTYEIAFDFRDIINITSMKPKQNEFMFDQLESLRSQGVTTIGISESSLDELEQLHRIDVFSAKELSLLTRDSTFDLGYTYLLFKNKEAEQSLAEPIRFSFKRINVAVDDWRFEGKKGLRISIPLSYAQKITLLPDEQILQEIKNKGFRMIFRIANRVPYNAAYHQRLLQMAHKYEMRWVFFDGESIPGFSEVNKETRDNIKYIANLMKRYEIGVATIELLRSETKGVASLARALDYNVARIHSINERDANAKPSVLSDRMTLAVKDRNIRIIFLNATVQFMFEKNRIVDTLEEGNIKKALTGPAGAIESLKASGYVTGTAQPYQLANPPLQPLLKLFSLLGALALILLLLTFFLGKWVSVAAILGLVFVAGLFILAPSLLDKALTLGAAVSAPALAFIFVLESVKSRAPSVLRAVSQFLIACAISMVGAVFVTGILFGPPFLVKLDYFRGVDLLYLAPIAISALFAVIYYKRETTQDRLQFVRDLLIKPVNVLMFVVVACGGVVVLYYLSRSGNSGQTIELELIIRSMLENVLGVRPRTKELLLAHPLFIFALYLSMRYKYGFYLLIPAVIGQLSIVSSFTHLHTPLIMSFLRTIYGMAGGILIGLLLIVLWQVAVKGWHLWARLQKR